MQELLQHIGNRALDVMSTGSPVEPLLTEFATALQAELPGSIVGITVLDKPGRTFRRAIFPDMPPEFSQSLEDNIITGNRGSCGRAVLTGKIVEVPDVANDERFSEEWKSLFKLHGLKAMLSIPALGPDGSPQGSVAVIHPYGAPLSAEQKGFVQLASVLCARLCVYSRTQETTQLLLGELEHRIRNLFLTIGGVASLTLRSYPDQSAFRKVFGERLVMLHRAHSLALNADEIDLASLMQEMLAPYCADYDVLFSGPDIVLAQGAASALALVIHELSTNAAKYGALSQPGGQLRVQWLTTVADESAAHTGFTLIWAESNGPRVEQPSRKGYGTAMINGNLRNAFEGAAAFFYEPAGFKCEISAPFTARLGRSRTPDSTSLFSEVDH